MKLFLKSLYKLPPSKTIETEREKETDKERVGERAQENMPQYFAKAKSKYPSRVFSPLPTVSIDYAVSNIEYRVAYLKSPPSPPH